MCLQISWLSQVSLQLQGNTEKYIYSPAFARQPFFDIFLVAFRHGLTWKGNRGGSFPVDLSQLAFCSWLNLDLTVALSTGETIKVALRAEKRNPDKIQCSSIDISVITFIVFTTALDWPAWSACFGIAGQKLLAIKEVGSHVFKYLNTYVSCSYPI